MSSKTIDLNKSTRLSGTWNDIAAAWTAAAICISSHCWWGFLSAALLIGIAFMERLLGFLQCHSSSVKSSVFEEAGNSRESIIGRFPSFVIAITGDYELHVGSVIILLLRESFDSQQRCVFGRITLQLTTNQVILNNVIHRTPASSISFSVINPSAGAGKHPHVHIHELKWHCGQ